MKDKISIIIPVYNVEKYLDRCVESVINQTFRNLEIILVDDGSPDNCPALCDEWARKDNRIIVIHKDNGGQAEARNIGIERATGDYIGFVDSDDMIARTMYNDLLQIIEKYHADLVGCRHIVFDDKQEPFFDDITLSGTIIEFNQEEAVSDIIREKHFEPTVWNLLVKASVAKKVKFDVGKIHEDILWPFRVILQSQKVFYIEKCYYAYFIRSGSTMNSDYSEKRFDALDALETRANIVKDYYSDLYPMAVKQYLGACMYHYQSLCRQPESEEYKNYKQILHKRFCNGDQKALFTELDVKYKIWYSMFKKAPGFTCKIRNTLKIGL